MKVAKIGWFTVTELHVCTKCQARNKKGHDQNCNSGILHLIVQIFIRFTFSLTNFQVFFALLKIKSLL